MDARPRRRLGDDQRRRRSEEFPQLRRDGDVVVAAPQHLDIAIAQQAEAGVVIRLQRIVGIENT